MELLRLLLPEPSKQQQPWCRAAAGSGFVTRTKHGSLLGSISSSCQQSSAATPQAGGRSLREAQPLPVSDGAARADAGKHSDIGWGWFLKHTAHACFVAVAVLRPSEHTVREVSEISSKELLGGLHRPDPTDTNSSPGESVAVLTPNQTATHGHTSGQSLPNHLRPCPTRRRHGLGCSHTAPGHRQGALVMATSGSTRHEPSRGSLCQSTSTL